ncbi:ATP synthase assembly factor FMC1, mitochondrial [Nakaseomyces bracarensis]|uniref:ATP synthase assembly factor FMC1, mitochondrial n=1 Tax=Nakaseomyces bracarensis TaxID=273131 RepID=A0ABR4NR18_9SACH
MSLVSTYRSLVRSIVKFERPNVIEQLRRSLKQDIAKLTYQRIQLVRDQMKYKNDAVKVKELNKQMVLLTARVEKLKKIDPANDKSTLFMRDKEMVRKQVLEGQGNAKFLTHLKNIEMFFTNQREYEELIERYNGKKISQEEKVKRTANRVGLEVPTF